MNERSATLRATIAFLNNIELILTVAGLGVILVLPGLFGTRNPWYVTALTAIFVGVLHGLIFWVVRRRQRVIRQQAIAGIRAMLQDRVNNQLAVIVTSTHLASRAPDRTEYAERINRTVKDISSALDNISEESLSHWENRYRSTQTSAAVRESQLQE